MIIPADKFLSNSAKSMKCTAIRERLKHLRKPGMMSFVAASTFIRNGSGHNTMRINFPFSDNTEIEEGVRRLSKVISEELTSE